MNPSSSMWKRYLSALKRHLFGSRRTKRERGRRGPSPTARLLIERLEDRTMLSVSVAPGSGNSVTILGTSGDAVWLRTNMLNLQYSTDATSYSNLGVTVNQDATVNLGTIGTVHLGSSSGDQIIGQGHALTFQNNNFGQAPDKVSIDNTVATGGGNLSILKMQAIEVSAGVTVSTRNIGASTDYLNAASVGNSGTVMCTAENDDTLNFVLNVDFNHPHITLGSGARLLAQVGAGDTTHAAGAVTLTATNTNFSLGTSYLSGLSVLAREATVTLNGATVEGGTIDVKSDAGDISLLGELAQATGNNSFVRGLVRQGL